MVAVGLIAAYLTIGVQGGWDFVLPFRGRRVGAMVVVGAAVAAATVAFQTLTSNRILTPSIMGFDALFQAIATVTVFAFGQAAMLRLGTIGNFAISLAVMLGASLALFWSLLGGARRSLHLVLLVGVVLGTMLRSLTLMLQRLLDPDAFLVLQGRLFASFSGVNPTLLWVSAAVVCGAVTVLFALRRRLDVMTLGRETATALGVGYRATTLLVVTLVAILISTATALVGPITFFGLLVANLAYHLARTHRHAWTLPIAALLAVVVLVGGQIILEHGFGQRTLLSVIVEFLGGIVFLTLLIAEGRRR
ncbi:MAG: iron chelate uptake ABC transporter family permease subunit [Promicromonosporaceae bacterium]|nr:iron chelate uptake ABC transporter family permease subunit [Promicromonosporaceae bacterium]